MKKLIKWIFIIIAFFMILIVIAALALPFFLPLDRIKNFVAAKMSDTLKREVTIGKVSFNIFTGIGIEDFRIGNKPGFSKKPFIKADKIELKYDLQSLFKGKIIIDKAAIIGPAILVEQKKADSNYSDLIPKKQPKAPDKKDQPKKEAGKLPVDINVSSFQIKGAVLEYIDYTGAKAQTSGFKDFNLYISGFTLDLSDPIGVNLNMTGIYQGKPVPVSLSALAVVNLDQDKVSILKLKVGAAGEYISSNIYISGVSKDQNIKFDLKSQKINIDKFMAIISGSEKEPPKEKAPAPPKGTLTRKVNEMSAKIPKGLVVDGDISLSNITYRELALDQLNARVMLNNRALKVFSKDTSAYNGKLNASVKVDFNTPGLGYRVSELSVVGFNGRPATNAFVKSFLYGEDTYKDLIDKIEGTLSLDLKVAGRGVEMPEVLSDAEGEVYFQLNDGAVRKIKSLEGVGSKIGLTTLSKDMELKILKATATLSRGILNVKSLHADNGNEGDVIIDFKGPLHLIKKEYLSGNVLTVKLSPRIAGEELKLLKDKDGWAVLEFELVGSLSKPIPVPKLDKPIEKVREKAAEELEKKVEEKKEEVKNDIDKKLEEFKEEAGEKLKDLFKP